MASSLPPYRYLIALANNAWDDPAAITSVAPIGTAGGHNAWTELTPRVRRHHSIRGRQHELSRFEAGVLDIDVQNDDGLLNPWNTSTPYTGLLVRRPFRVIVGSTPKFTGMASLYRPMWPDNFTGTLRIRATDALRALAQAPITYPTTSAYAAAVLADNPTNYWRLSDTGHTAADIGSTPNTGTYQGFGQQQSAPGALLNEPSATGFNTGASQGWVSLNNPQPFAPTACSVEFWVKFRGGPLPIMRIYTNFDSGGQLQAVNAQPIDSAGNVLVAPFFALTMFIANTGHNQDFLSVPPGVQLVDGQWHHVVMVETSSISGSYTYYIDTLNKSLAHGPPVGAPITLSGSGTGSLFGLASGGSFANAVFQEMAFYNYALTGAQVSAHYAAAFSSPLPIRASETSGHRINYLLDTAGWPAGPRNIDNGDITVQPITAGYGNSLGSATKALADMQAVEVTENGALFVDMAGRVRFMSASSVVAASSTPLATFDDIGGLIYQPDPELVEDDVDLFNIAVINNQGNPQYVTGDSTSVNTFGPSFLDLTGIWNDQNDAVARGASVLAAYKQPFSRLRRMTIKPLDNPSVLGPEVVFRELMDCISVQRHGVPGDPYITVANVERIEETIDAVTGDWTVEYGLSIAIPA